MPHDTSLLFIKGNRSREDKALCARKYVCAFEHVCSGEQVSAALNASNTQRYSSEYNYTEVTAETSPSASVPVGQFTLCLTHTFT